jgi:hypothetical protein
MVLDRYVDCFIKYVLKISPELVMINEYIGQISVQYNQLY